MILGYNTTIRWSGNIRSGYKDAKGNPVNTPHFVLTDAPQLETVLGKNPKEIYFTTSCDSLEEISKLDLKWYKGRTLACHSMHNALDDSGVKMGRVAAYRLIGSPASGLSQSVFPGYPRARVRECATSCPQLIKGDCYPYLALSILVPQYSLTEHFVVRTTSDFAVRKTLMEFTQVRGLYNKKISGQIFRLSKKVMPMRFPKADGTTGTKETPLVIIEHVPFSTYQNMFEKSTSPEQWDLLMRLRERKELFYFGIPCEFDFEDIVETDSDENGGSLIEQSDSSHDNVDLGTLLDGVDDNADKAKKADDAITAIANDPEVVVLFNEYGKLINKEATEKIRKLTAKKKQTADELKKYLKNLIDEEMKKRPPTTKEAGAAEAPSAPSTEITRPSVAEPNQAADPQGSPFY